MKIHTRMAEIDFVYWDCTHVVLLISLINICVKLVAKFADDVVFHAAAISVSPSGLAPELHEFIINSISQPGTDRTN
jgi:hypothetical protein